MTRKAEPADVDEICGRLPGTWFGESWGDVPTWLVPQPARAARDGSQEKGRGFVLYRKPHKSAIDPDSGQMYDDLLVIRTANESDKLALVQDEATPFFTIPHFNGYSAVLLRLSRIGELEYDELAEVITDAFRATAPGLLVKELDV